MNKKILTSVSLIALVSLIAIGGTIAYFNDTQTSAGNIIVAGTMNLKIDHLKQTYGIMDCKTCSVEVYSSDGHDMVVEKNGVAVETPYSAALAWVHPVWLKAAVFDPTGEAKWIWESSQTQQADTQVNTSYGFQNTFEWMGEINGATLNLALASDNGYQVYLNGNPLGQDPGEFNYSSADSIVVNPSYFIQGTNILKFVVTNKGVAGSNYQTNPAGLIYKFTINGNCGDDYFKTNCKLWQAKDLVEGDTFFDFDDVKPGDYGTNLISVHVNGNDAWSCFYAKKSDDVDEDISEDLNVIIWNDANQNGTYQDGEAILHNGNLIDTNIALAEQGLPPITGGTTQYIGLAWCFGTQTISGDTISCDGSSVGNEAQGDTLSATLTTYAEQWRNNPNFDCSNTPIASEE
ncbi:MAG: SipW-dependent-type signal peptide-containing protein [Minisyncoccales bacterium]